MPKRSLKVLKKFSDGDIINSYQEVDVMETLQKAKNELNTANKEIMEFINAFADDMSFVQTDAFMCSQNAFADMPGEGVVSGFASIDGTPVCLFATNPAVLKGSIGAQNAKKIVKAINNAVRMNKPLIAVWDTSGARIAEGIDCLDGYGDILRAYTVAYGDIPIVSVIKGNNFGISSYVSGLSDFTVAFDGAVSASTSPLVLAAKTGESEKSVGTVKSLAERGIVTNITDKKGLRKTLIDILSVFSASKQSGDDPNRVGKGLRVGSSIDAVIKEVFDKNSFLQVREAFAPIAVTGFATLADITVGVVATDITKSSGRLTADACIKISEFLNVCENVECPVVFLTDCAGTEICADDARLIREMSNLIYRIYTLDTDMFSVVVGKAIGAAYTALVAPCAYKIAWDGAEIAALGSEETARLIYADEIKKAKDKDKAAAKFAESYSQENNSALVLAKSGHFDNVIEPALTRSYLIAALLAHVE